MKYVIILGIVALAICAFAYFALFGSEPAAVPATTGNQSDSTVVDESTFTDRPLSGIGTLSDLSALSQDLECQVSFTPEDQEASVDGTYFVSQGQMRADFLVWSAELGNQVSSMIVLPEVTYVWSDIDGETYGMTFQTSTFDDEGSEVVDDTVVRLDEEVEYTCSEWQNVDRSVFQPPADVQFQDYSDLMQQGMEYGTIYETQAEAGIEIPGMTGN